MVGLSLLFREFKLGLKYLDLSGNKFSSEGLLKLLNGLRSSQNLKKLNISNNDLHNYSSFTVVEGFLGANKALEELNFSGCQLSNYSA